MYIFLVLLLIFTPCLGSASEFEILGIRPLGMGGAQVANPEGAGFSYWNPGGLGLDSATVLDVPLSAHFSSRGNVLKSIDAGFRAVDAAKAMNDRDDKVPTLEEARQFTRAVQEVTKLNESGTGAVVGINAGITHRVGHWGMSLNNFSEAGGSGLVDTQVQLTLNDVSGDAALTDPADQPLSDELATTVVGLQNRLGISLPPGVTPTTIANHYVNLARKEGKTTQEISDLIQQGQALVNQLQPTSLPPLPASVGTSEPAGTNALDNNRSQGTVIGAQLTEIVLGRGWEVPFPKAFGRLGVGGNLKAIRGDLEYERVRVAEGKASNFGRRFGQSRVTSYTAAADLGVQWYSPQRRRRWQGGLLVRNMTPMKFDVPQEAGPDGAGFPSLLTPQVRLGAAWLFNSLTTLAADLDLTSNPTLVPGFRSRQFALGVERRWGWFLARAGLLEELVAMDPPLLSLGIGLRPGQFRLDIGVMTSTEWVTIQEIHKTVPDGFQFGLSLGWRFGPRHRHWLQSPKHPKPQEKESEWQEKDAASVQKLLEGEDPAQANVANPP